MTKIKILCLIMCICIFGTQAYALENTMRIESDIKDDLEKTYGVNIIIPEEDGDFTNCILTLEKSFRKFPHNIIKEITDYYLKNGIVTNIVIDTTEDIEDLFSRYRVDTNTNIYINALESSLYSESCFVSEEVVMHELAHFISNYLFEIHSFQELETKFEKLNQDYENEIKDYCNLLVNIDSAYNLKDEVADLIWHAEAYPSIIRNINDGDTAIIHKKLELLGKVLEENFNSISEDTRLWLDAFPQKPNDWAKDKIVQMKNISLIPEELDGMYESYITRENFYKLVLNLLDKKIGEENLNKYFNVMKFEDRIALDPVNGRVLVDEVMYQTYPIEILNSDFFKNPEGHMSRLEVAKSLVYIGSKLGMDITEFDVIDYNDIDEIEESEKPYIYLAASKGFIKGDGISFKPYDYCTYQEAYIILMRFYNNI